MIVLDGAFTFEHVPPASVRIPADQLHYNARGHELLAEALAVALGGEGE